MIKMGRNGLDGRGGFHCSFFHAHGALSLEGSLPLGILIGQQACVPHLTVSSLKGANAFASCCFTKGHTQGSAHIRHLGRRTKSFLLDSIHPLRAGDMSSESLMSGSGGSQEDMGSTIYHPSCVTLGDCNSQDQVAYIRSGDNKRNLLR